MRKKLLLPIIFAIFQYILIFRPVFNKHLVPFGGNDMLRIHLPAREYLYKTLKSGKFPFWIEYKLSGYPMYADLENQYLNPLNVLLVYVFGPYTSLKILLFVTYICGSYGLYLLLKKHNVNFLGFIAANTIYFFNLYMFFHLEHLGILMTVMLIPLGLYLFSNFNKSVKRVLVLALFDVYVLTLGSFQLIFISMIVRLFYYLCFMYTKERLNKDIRKILGYILLTITLSLPVLIPSIQLYLLSSGASRVNFTEGSLSPINLLSGVIPFMYGKEGYFDGYVFCENCVIHELYFYFGITSLFLFLVSVILSKSKKIKLFAYLLIFTAVILSVIGKLPLAQFLTKTPLNYFRYWPRSLIMIPLGISFVVSDFLSQKKSSKINLTSLVPYIAISVLVSLFQVRITGVKFVKDFIYYLRIYSFQNPNAHMNLWLSFLVLAVIASLLLFVIRNRLDIVKVLFVVLIVIDLGIFHYLSIRQDGFIEKTKFPSRQKCLENFNWFENYTRVLDLSGCVNDRNAHLTNVWSILGRTQYTSQEYTDSLKNFGLDREREIDKDMGEKLMNELDIEKVKQFGIGYIYSPDGEIIDLENPLVQGANLLDVVVEPGKVVAKMNDAIDEFTLVKTYIRFFPGWKLFVDGKNRPLDMDPGEFINFSINPGQASFTLKYRPVGLFVGGLITLFLFPLMCITTRKLYPK